MFRCLIGEASFVSNHEINVNGEIIRGKQIVVATGASPALPEIDGLSEVNYHTSDTIMRIAEVPKRLGIIGGGYIAVELAHVFSSFGCEVIMLVRGNTLLSKEDFSIRDRFNKAFHERVDLRFGVSVSKVWQDNNCIQLSFEDEEEVSGGRRVAFSYWSPSRFSSHSTSGQQTSLQKTVTSLLTCT